MRLTTDLTEISVKDLQDKNKYRTECTTPINRKDPDTEPLPSKMKVDSASANITEQEE